MKTFLLDDRCLDFGYSPYGPIACASCNNYVSDYKCRAFPGGIPQAILDGKDSHTEPHEGDNGIQFEAVDK